MTHLEWGNEKEFSFFERITLEETTTMKMEMQETKHFMKCRCPWLDYYMKMW